MLATLNFLNLKASTDNHALFIYINQLRITEEKKLRDIVREEKIKQGSSENNGTKTFSVSSSSRGVFFLWQTEYSQGEGFRIFFCFFLTDQEVIHCLDFIQ